MINITKLYFLLLTLLMVSCSKPPESQATPQQTVMSSPTPNLTPDSNMIHLIYPPTVTSGDTFRIEVKNDGAIPYAFHVPDQQTNCLAVTKEADFVMASLPECDVFAEYVVHPGESKLVGRWDLAVCTNIDCFMREPASPGQYYFELRLYPYHEGQELIFEDSFVKKASFVIVGSEENNS